ncbi:hypothetical protein KIN20_028052 [Parelaphostrongylus tenuis]|uniref:Uncharacterized protein n=1 Tax=Parelaphostrongylus tenuis TaxID=148309 RepID=A0AAD5WEB4_PARTN|nr:hypothetical protein KIN20_028052 [Parelaphostrongylus tenuis]
MSANDVGVFERQKNVLVNERMKNIMNFTPYRALGGVLRSRTAMCSQSFIPTNGSPKQRRNSTFPSVKPN